VTRLAGRADPSKTMLVHAAPVGRISLSALGPFVWRTPDSAGWRCSAKS
jgi:hypothetical protein